jgi:hypothetical protein
VTEKLQFRSYRPEDGSLEDFKRETREKLRRRREMSRTALLEDDAAAYGPPREEQLATALHFKITSNIPVPPDALREDRLKATKARNRKRTASLRPGARLTLDAALWRAIPPQRNRKRYFQAQATIGILAGLGRYYVDEVTEEDLLAVAETSVAQGLSPAAARYRLSCLSTLGVKARVVWYFRRSTKGLITIGN